MCKVEWSKKAKKNLSKLDPSTKEEIIDKVENKLTKDPYKGVGVKPLRGESRKDQWRYRIGDYRVIYRIIQDKVIIEVLKVAHRREVHD